MGVNRSTVRFDFLLCCNLMLNAPFSLALHKHLGNEEKVPFFSRAVYALTTTEGTDFL